MLQFVILLLDYNDGKIRSCGLAVEHLAHDRKIVGSIPIQMLDGSDVKAMPGSIYASNSGSL